MIGYWNSWGEHLELLETFQNHSSTPQQICCLQCLSEKVLVTDTLLWCLFKIYFYSDSSHIKYYKRLGSMIVCAVCTQSRVTVVVCLNFFLNIAWSF